LAARQRGLGIKTPPEAPFPSAQAVETGSFPSSTWPSAQGKLPAERAQRLIDFTPFFPFLHY
jgi:hypothetical protein